MVGDFVFQRYWLANSVLVGGFVRLDFEVDLYLVTFQNGFERWKVKQGIGFQDLGHYGVVCSLVV